jgi:hypothetical protein
MIGGVSAAFLELLRILIEKDIIQIRDWDRITETLDALPLAHDIHPDQKEAVDAYSGVMKRLRPGKITPER